jgi:hypothetical protein
MTESDKTRIVTEAKKFRGDSYFEIEIGYVAGATAEHPHAWNAALEKVADMLREKESDHLSSYARRVYIDLAKELELLKIKE